MSRFGLFGKISTHPGQRDALVDILLQAAASLRDDHECELYIVSTSPTEPDVIYVTEAWSSRAAHEASLAKDGVRVLIQRGMPLIAGGERTELVPVGGKGLAAD
jgi:quinol monooxygenase YgiN